MATHIIEAIAEEQAANSMLLRQLIRPQHGGTSIRAGEPQVPTPTELNAMIAAARRMIDAR